MDHPAPSPASHTPPTITPGLLYHAAPKAIEWLCRVYGFQPRRVVPGEPGRVLHAHLVLGNGGVMLSSAEDYGHPSMCRSPRQVGGVGTAEIVVHVPEIEAHYRHAVAQGAEILIALEDKPYGGRGYASRDPEGHVWAFGSYDAWAPEPAPQRQRATGTFEVTMQPLPAREPAASPLFARRSLDKRFSGDLVGTGCGEMLSAGTATPGSAVYVAIEQVTGTLQGRQGGFVFRHTGTMDRGQPSLAITVVPDSGTGELTGLRGDFSLEIVDGQHRYVFEYTLPAPD